MTTTAQPTEPPKAVRQKTKRFSADEKGKETLLVADFSFSPRRAAGKAKDATDKHPALLFTNTLFAPPSLIYTNSE